MNRNMIEIRFDNGDRLFLNKTLSRKPYQPKEHLNEHHNIAKAMQWMFLPWELINNTIYRMRKI